MKLLNILIGFLISSVCFGQDLVEYEDGIFFRNGVELSIEQVEQLSLEYKVLGKTRDLINQGVASNDLVKPES
jgi:hypothetical protein